MTDFRKPNDNFLGGKPRKKQSRKLVNTKLLFLDVDGVLNDKDTLAVLGIMSMHPRFVAQLARILRETNCKIVVSSSWRVLGVGPDSDFQKALHAACTNFRPGSQEDFDLIIASLVDCTPPSRWSYRPRGIEIQEWFDNTFKAKGLQHDAPFVIVDDDPDMAHLMDHLVQTKFEGAFGDTGLTKEKADLIIKKLNGDESLS